MYSVVLMALSGQVDLPEFGCRCRGCNGYSCGCRGRRGHRCCGCYGYYYGCCGTYTVVPCCGPTPPAYTVVPCCGPNPPAYTIPPQGTPPSPKPKPPGPPTWYEEPALIQVSLPPNAKLTIDGFETTRSTSAQQTFITPPLPVDQSFVYTFKAEMVKNGRAIFQTHEVIVRGGQEIRVSIFFPSGEVASSR